MSTRVAIYPRETGKILGQPGIRRVEAETSKPLQKEEEVTKVKVSCQILSEPAAASDEPNATIIANGNDEGQDSSPRPPAADYVSLRSTIILANVQVLCSVRKRYKVKMLQELMVGCKAIIAAFTETHLSQAILDAEVHIKGYTLYRSDRAGRQQGGVAMYVVDDLAADTKVISMGSNGVVEHIVLYIKKYNLIAVTVYRPPSAELAKFSSVIAKKLDGR